MNYDHVRDQDPAVADALTGEVERQNDTLAMIASENHVSEAVLEAQGSTLTNKYAEGYPGERYYGGCEYADEVEQLAIDRAQELYGADHVNVQPHSGSQANMGVYLAVLDPGDKILSLDLTHGGHLSHGHPANFAGQVYEVEQYEVDAETGYIDYDDLREQAEAYDPDIIVSGYSAYPRVVDWERMQTIADAVDAVFVADIAHLTGLVAAGVHPSPVGVADVVTCSTHKTIRAGRGGMIMCDEELASAVDRAVMPGTQGGPLVHNMAGKAAGFHEALQPDFEAYATQIVDNAHALGEQLKRRGFDLVSDGTDVHFALVDFRDTHPELSGEAAEAALADVGIVASKSTVPGEQRSPTVGSGIRLGTPPITTRGFDADDSQLLANVIADVLDAPEDQVVVDRAVRVVDQLCEEHPLYEPETRPAMAGQA